MAYSLTLTLQGNSEIINSFEHGILINVSLPKNDSRKSVKGSCGKMQRSIAEASVCLGILGIMIATRGRYHPRQWKNLPKVYPNGFSQGADQDALRDRTGAIVRGLVYSGVGILVGQSVGFGLGTWQSSQIIKREGNYENIEKVMKKVRKDVAEKYGREGMIDGLNNSDSRSSQYQKKKLQGLPSTQPSSNEADFNNFYGEKVGTIDNTRLARNFENDGQTNRAWGETPFAKELGNEPQRSLDSAFPFATGRAEEGESGTGSSCNFSYTARYLSLSLVHLANSPPKSSRWDELRGSRNTKMSAWEDIRQLRAQQELRASNRPRNENEQSPFDEQPPIDGFSEDQRRAEEETRKRVERERQRKEYDRMFEKESRGEDSI